MSLSILLNVFFKSIFREMGFFEAIGLSRQYFLTSPSPVFIDLTHAVLLLFCGVFIVGLILIVVGTHGKRVCFMFSFSR